MIQLTRATGTIAIAMMALSMASALAVVACDDGDGDGDGDSDVDIDADSDGDGDADSDGDGDADSDGDVDTDADADSDQDGDTDPISAPLRVHPDNPRYFIDGRGKAIRLAGHQIFVDLQDNSFNKPETYGHAAELDWSWYLDFASERHLNVIRNWIIWSAGSGTAAPPDAIAHPMMYERTGPATAADGLPAFDLTRFDDAFFDRLRSRVADAEGRGIYVTIMLFEPYGFGPGEDEGGQTLWHGNVWRGENNVNGIDVNNDGNEWGTEFFYTTDPQVLDLQRSFVDRVVDTVNDLDNVIYEVANEVYSPDWQMGIIEHIREYEATKPSQHLIYMSPGGRNESGGWTAHTKAQLVESGADLFGVSGSMGDYEHDPPVDDSGMPAIWDNDHIWGDDWTHHRRAWMAFTRGYHFIFYDHPFEAPDEESTEFETMRRNIGATNEYAERFADLARMNPHGELSSTGYCLADPGAEYLVYQPTSGELTVELEAGTYDYEWFDCDAAAVSETGSVEVSGGAEPFTPPESITADAALYLRSSP